MIARLSTIAKIRLAGIFVIALLSFYGAATRSDLDSAWTTAIFGILPLIGFLWLCATGYFTFGSARQSDWVALLPFSVALLLRELFTLHSLQEIVIYFARDFWGRHSIVYPLLQLFFVPLVDDAQAFVTHMNGVLGAFAALALYLFVRQRTGSRTAALLCSLFLATHPVVTRFSPTDAPYSMMLASWFSGLALLSSPEMGGRAIFGGAVLLGIAATCRMEGPLTLVASLLLLDLRAIATSVRRQPQAAAMSVIAIALLGAVQMYFLLPFHLSGPNSMASFFPSLDLLRAEAASASRYNDRLFVGLVLLGAAAGALSHRHRLGLYAFGATLIVLFPVAGSGKWIVALHRMVPTYALQTICAGVGAWWITAWSPQWARRHLLGAVPGALIACFVLFAHRHDLTERYVFNEEYELVRSHLAPRGKGPAECSLLTCNRVPAQDADIHDFGDVVPEMKILDCWSEDCIAAVSGGGCFYYVRTVGCYFHSAKIPPSCVKTEDDPPVDPLLCLIPPLVTFETSVALQPIEVRTLQPLNTFTGSSLSYPTKVQVGLFRAEPMHHVPSPPP